MNTDEMKQHWQLSSQDMFADIAQWRKANPHAALAEIEHAVDEHFNKLRAQMIQDAAHVEAARTSSSETSSRTACLKCGAVCTHEVGTRKPCRSQEDMTSPCNAPTSPVLRVLVFSPSMSS
jgi:hypothetical protein